MRALSLALFVAALAHAGLMTEDVTGVGDSAAVSALHREDDKDWKHRVGSAAAEPAADEEVDDETTGSRSAAPVEDSTFEDAVPKRRRYSRKRPRPGGESDSTEEDTPVSIKRRKITRVGENEQSTDDRRRKPVQRRRRPKPEADPAGEQSEQQSESTEKSATPADLKALLKQTAGQLSLSELLQNRNLSLADLLKGNRGALSALTARPSPDDGLAGVTDKSPRSSPAPVSQKPTSRSFEDSDHTTERHNSFVPSKPRRLPAVVRTTPTARTTEEPEITTSRPRRLPAIMTKPKVPTETYSTKRPAPFRPKEDSHEHKHLPGGQNNKDTLDIMSPEMMAMISLEAADTHTSKPRRILPTYLPTPSSGRDSHSTTQKPITTDREFYPLNVDSLEITTPKLMGVSKPREQDPVKPWLPPDRIIDAQVFSPGAISHKFRPHGFELPSSTQPDTIPPFDDAFTTLPTLPPSKEELTTKPAPRTEPPTTLLNSTTNFKIDNETADQKEENSVDKRKQPAFVPILRSTAFPDTTTKTEHTNELSKADDNKQDKKKSPPRRLPPTLAGTRRLPAILRHKNHTELSAESISKERPKLTIPNTRPKLKDTLLPPTRFALPLPEVISVEKMIQDAKNREALLRTSESPESTTSTTTRVGPTFSTRDEILDLLKSEQSSARLARILAARNMTLDDLIQHRERGSSQLHFADFFRNSTKSEQPVNLVPKEITPSETKENTNILSSFHEVPKYPFSYGGSDDSEEAASTLSLVNVNPGGAVLTGANTPPADSSNRDPRIFDSMPSFKPAPFPVPTFRLTDPHAAGNPYLVIKHLTTVRPEIEGVVLEQSGEARLFGSNAAEDAVVVDTDSYTKLHEESRTLPSGVKSAIIASSAICGLAIFGFLTIFIVFRWRQKRAILRARGAILCEQLQRGSFRGRSLSPVLVNISKSQAPYYSKKDLSSRATSNTASNRHYYLWRSLRKTFQEDDME